MDQRPIAWITGAGGLIGHNLVESIPAEIASQWNVIGWTRQQLELTDFAQVRSCYRQHMPQLIIHCAALSRSPECQANPAYAHKINVEVTAHLAELATNIAFLFFSSDLVFDGAVGHYDETAPVNPLGIYAETKVKAEQIVLANPQHTVIRTSLTGGVSPTGDRGFNEALRRAWQAGKKVTLFTDEFRSPLSALVTARAIWHLVALPRPGLYHLAGHERLSRWQIGQLVAARWPQLHPQILPGTLRDYAGPPRAPDTSLNCTKLQQLLPFPLPGLTHWLANNPQVIF